MGLNSYLQTIPPENRDIDHPYILDFSPQLQFWILNNLTSDGQSGDYIDCFGVASLSAFRSRTFKSDDAVADSATAWKNGTTGPGVIINSAGTVQLTTGPSFSNPNSWYQEPSTDDAVDRLISVLSLAGFRDVKVGSFVTATGTGNFDITDVGFDPDVVIVFTARLNTASTSTSAVAPIRECIGWFCRDGTQGVVAGSCVQTGQASSVAYRYQRTNSIIAEVYEVDGTIIEEIAFVSMLSNGFRLNYTTLSTGGHYIYYVAIKGVNAAAFSFNGGAATGDITAVSSLSFKPSLYFLQSFCNAASTVAVTNAIHAFAFYKASAYQFCRITSFRDGQATMQADQTLHRDRTFQTGTMGVGGLILRDTFQHVSFDSGGITINCSTASGVDKQILGLALGESYSPTVKVLGKTKVLGKAKVL